MKIYLTGNEVLNHVKKALLLSYKAVLGKGAESRLRVDTYNDIKTLGDVTVSEAWSLYFKNSGLPIVLYTEELKEPLSFSNKPICSAVGDEIDGTHNLKYGLGMLPYGGILGIADKVDPKFKDFIASGFLEYNSGNLFYAIRGEGAYVIEGWAKGRSKSKQLRTSSNKKLDDPELNVIADVYMLGDLAKIFMPYVAKRGGDFRCTSLHLVMVASGSCDAFILGDNCPNPQKIRTGEEIGLGYLLVEEAGGAMLNWNGDDIGNERIALHEKKTFHIVAATTKDLGIEVVSEMKKIPEIVEYMKKKKEAEARGLLSLMGRK